MLYRLLTLVAITTHISSAYASEELAIENETDRFSYSLGHQVGRDFRNQNVELSPNALMQGLMDATMAGEPLLSPVEMHALLVDMKKQIQITEVREKRQKAEQYREKGREFLAKNAKDKDIKILPSGMQYKVIRVGQGKSPKPTDSVTVSYRGTLINGREFDSSYREGKPAQYRVDKVMPGWTEALQKMQEGAAWQLFIPSNLGYRRRGPLANRTLIYEIELIAINQAVDQKQSSGDQEL
jgi:FKBP-type peptidyl-prolyl cis-trans isomerase FklB